MKTNDKVSQRRAQDLLRKYIMLTILPDLNLTFAQRAQLADIALNMARMNEHKGDNRNADIQTQLELI